MGEREFRVQAKKGLFRKDLELGAYPDVAEGRHERDQILES